MTDDPVHDLHQAVDDLIKPPNRKLLREPVDPALELVGDKLKMATDTKPVIPSLWDQLEAALGHGGEQPEGSRPVPDSKPTLDPNVLEVRAQVVEQVVRELRHYKLKSRSHTVTRITRWWDHGEWINADGKEPVCVREPGWQQMSREVSEIDLPASLRQLAMTVVADSADAVDWWTYRLLQFARIAKRALGDDLPLQPRRIRDHACPKCLAAHHYTLDLEGEGKRVPPLVIDFLDGLVRAVSCSLCGQTWFRGEQLHQLGHELGTAQCCIEETA